MCFAEKGEVASSVFKLARQHGMVPCNALVGCMLAAAVQLGSPSSVLAVWQELQGSGGALGLRAHANLLFSLTRCASTRCTVCCLLLAIHGALALVALLLSVIRCWCCW